MDLIISTILKNLLLPSGIFLVLLVAAILLLRKKPLFSRFLLILAVAGIYLLSTDRIAGYLVANLETYPALNPQQLDQYQAGAIVVLSAGRDRNALEYGGQDSAGANTLIRSRYGAFLHRQTGLPVVVSGGFVINKEGLSLARIMANLLTDEFRVTEVWLEENSRTTRENAIYSQQLLAQKNVDTVFLVTQAWHMPRAVDVFEKAGLKVIPAPTAFKSGGPKTSLGWLPDTRALNDSRLALHEMLGSLWYNLTD